MILRAKNWEEFQHYKDRDPPWIKLHKRLLDDRVFHRLPDASRALAPCLWLLCSETKDGTIKDAVAEISFRLRMTEKKAEEALNPLIEAGFFIVEQDASTTLAPCEHSATQRQRQRHIEKTEESRPASKGSRLPADWKPTEEELRYAAEQGCADPADTAERFRLHHASKGTIGKDWHAGFQYWCRNEKNFKSTAQTYTDRFAKPDVSMPSTEEWGPRMIGWRQSKFWRQDRWGPPPGESGCRVPKHMIGGTA